jgi:hypothetical protein
MVDLSETMYMVLEVVVLAELVLLRLLPTEVDLQEDLPNPAIFQDQQSIMQVVVLVVLDLVERPTVEA